MIYWFKRGVFSLEHVLDALFFLDLYDELCGGAGTWVREGYFHASAGEVEEEVAEVYVDDSTEVVPSEVLRVVHEEV